MRTVRDAVHAFLLDHGVTRIFGNPGSTEMRFFRDWPDTIDYVLGLQESSVVAMADGYAQATGTVGVAMVHSAAGLGHGMGSVYTACRNQTPLLVIAGQQTRALLTGDAYLQARDATEFPRPYVKFSVEPARPSDVPAAIAQAFRIARTPPSGPVFVSVPEDDWDHPAEPLPGRGLTTSTVAPVDALRPLAEALRAARRPAFVLGAGVQADHGRAAATALAERTGADVLAAPLSGRSSFAEDHPRFAGFLPPAAAELRGALTAYDVIAVVGAPMFTLHVETGGPVVPEGRAVWHITDDPDQLARAEAGTGILSSPRLALETLAELVGPGSDRRLPRPASRLPLDEPAPGMSPEYVLHTLAAALPESCVVVEEAPTHRNALHEHLPIRAGQRFHAAASGGLGWAMPAAIGMALAEPALPVVCLIGDGSSLYSIQSLWTAARHVAHVVFVVLNNGGYAAMKAFGRRLRIPKAPGLDLPGIRLTEVAAGLGVRSESLTDVLQLAPAFARALASDLPSLLDIRVRRAAAELY